LKKKENIDKNSMNIENNKHNDNKDNTYNDISPYGWDCVIYIYADKTNEKNLQFWSKKKELDYLRLYCDLHENPGKMVCMYVYIYMCMCACLCIYFKNIYIYIYTYTYGCIHIYI
jgi:hypothetical protein